MSLKNKILNFNLKIQKNILKAEARKNGKIINISDDYELTKPELKVEINNQKAADLGVSIEQIGRTIETIFGSRKVTKFTNNGKEYSIVLQAQARAQGAQAQAALYMRSDAVQHELVSILCKGSANSLDVERKHNQDKRFEKTDELTCASLAEQHPGAVQASQAYRCERGPETSP